MQKRFLLSFSLLILAAMLVTACTSPSGSAAAAGQDDSATDGLVETTGESTAITDESSSTSEGAGLCANEFFPLRSDKTWHYTVTSGDTRNDYSITYKDITDSSFVVVQTWPNASSEVGWQCNAEGMLSSNYATINMNSSPDVTFDTLQAEGITLPPESEWEIGKVWDMNYTAQVTINNNGTEIQADGEIDISREIAAIETVTVSAGTYENAYRVDSTGLITINLMGTKTSTPLIYSDWYVKGVGLVKSASSEANLSYDLELVSFE